MTTVERRLAAAEPAVANVRLDRLTKRFDDVVAVDDVTLEIERGSFFALLGPSGCGKTTTLRMIGGFEEPTAGTIHLGEQDVTRLAPYGSGERGTAEPSRWSADKELEWIALRPELVVEISYEQVSGDRIRHGTKLVRWREDKPPRECGIEQLRS